MIPTYNDPDFDPNTDALAFYEWEDHPYYWELYAKTGEMRGSVKDVIEDQMGHCWKEFYREEMEFYEGSECALCLDTEEQMFEDWGIESGYFAWCARHDQSQLWTHYAAEAFLLRDVPVPTEEDEFYFDCEGAFA